MNPSLLLIPDRYKAAKLYSQIPDSGAGDLTFARNSNATRVNSAGLIEKVRTNLVLHSEDFTNAAWTKYQTNASGNTTIAPNGTTTADTLAENTSNDIHVAFQSNTVVAGELTVSCYAKANTKNYAWLQIYDGSTFQASGIFNLTAGTVSGAGTITNVGNGWYRLSFTATVVAGSTTSYIGLSDGTNVSYTGALESIFVWGYQTEQGVLTPYIPTTTAAVSVGITADIPRLDYTGGGCPSLLLESQRANLVTFSEQFDNAAWTKQNGSVTANTTVSPDGYTNADTFTSDSTTGEHNAYTTTAITTLSSAFTASCYVKALTGRYFCLSNYQAGQNYSAYATFDLQTGTTVATGAIFGTYISNSIQSVGNGWYRVSVTGSGVTSNFVGLNAMTAANFNPSVGTLGQGQSYAIYGVQLEQGSYATSYIPTLGSSVTRLADAAFKTGISSLIGGGVGTWFMDFEMVEGTGTGNPFAFDLSDGTTSNRLYLYWNESLQSWYWGGGDTGITLPSTLRKKVAVKFSGTTAKLFCNGISIGTNTISAAFTRLDIGQRFSNTFPMDGKINQAYFLTTSLTDAECISLTTI